MIDGSPCPHERYDSDPYGSSLARHSKRRHDDE